MNCIFIDTERIRMGRPGAPGHSFSEEKCAGYKKSLLSL